tara:strand:+ start:589 stop:852 length:264 start_codon:yes stop_codon:yes gene_type:complete
MTEIINIKEHQIRRKHRNVKSADKVTKDGVEALLHKLHECNFPIEDPLFQQDLALAFKFVHAAISKYYGIENPFYEAIDKFKKDIKW